MKFNLSWVTPKMAYVIIIGFFARIVLSWSELSSLEYWANIADGLESKYVWLRLLMLSANLSLPLLLFTKLKHQFGFVFFVALGVNFGVMMERFVVLTTSIHRDFGNQGIFYPTYAFFVQVIFPSVVIAGALYGYYFYKHGNKIKVEERNDVL
jgi:hypothetical protein